MSYQAIPRVLEQQAGAAPPPSFADAVAAVLQCDLPAQRVAQAVTRLGRVPGQAAVTQDLRGLLALDVGPTAQVFRRLASRQALVDMWNAYNTHGNVQAPSMLQGQGDGLHCVFRFEQQQADRTLELMTHVWIEILQGLIQRRAERAPLSRPDGSAASLSELARLMNAGSLVEDACTFFEVRPEAQVPDLARHLALHPRTLARRLDEVGLTPLALKRACALVGATRDLLETDLSLTTIAARHGYSDGAHLTRQVRQATGGFSPSELRRLVRS